MDPPALELFSASRPVEVVIPFTEWALAEATIRRAVVLAADLPVALQLIAVHTVPYPLQFGCLAGVHAILVEQLIELASDCPLPVHPRVVLARSRQDGFRSAMTERSTVLIGSRKRPWKTAEERLGDMLAEDGHQVILAHVE
jgi:hypothetical protein